MSHREIRELVCELEPRPDVAPSVRKLPQRPAPDSGSPLQLGAPRVEPAAVNSRVESGRPPLVERHIPAAVRRLVYERGGDHSPTDVTLMCKSTLGAEQDYGEEVMERFRAAASRASVPVDAYGARIVVRPRGV